MSLKKRGRKPKIQLQSENNNEILGVNNIEQLVDGLGLDLFTEVINWEEIKDLQLSFFRSGVPHIDVPQDHAFFATMYKFASQNRVKYILTGGNYSTECVREPLDWVYHASDLRQLKDIHSNFGTKSLDTYPTADIFKYKIYYRIVKGMEVVKPLNYVEYNKDQAMKLLENKYNFSIFKNLLGDVAFNRCK